MDTQCLHDYEHAIRKGRASYTCPKCNGDISLQMALLSVAMIEEDERKERL